MVVGQRLSALDEPVTRVGGRWLGSWSMAMFGLFLAHYGTAQVLLPKQANAVTGNSVDAVNLQVWANLLSSLIAVVGAVLVGILSDRTLHSRGRRQIWVTVGAVLMGIGLVAQGVQQVPAAVVASWCVVQIGISLVGSALLAAVPDVVPVNQRATVSSYYGVAQTVGTLLGVFVVTAIFTGLVSGYVGLAVLFLLFALPFALGTRDVPLRPEERPAATVWSTVVGVVEPLKHADLRWAWAGRFLIQLCAGLSQIYLYQYLRDRVHVDPDTGTLLLVFVYTIGAVVAALPVGRISDRTGRRKPMVVASSLLQGAAGLLLAFAPTMLATVASAALGGLGYGAYMAVDQALITQVLPSARDRGRDLGVLHIADAAPYVLASAAGGVVLNYAGGYVALYLAVVVAGIVAAFTVVPIKSVR